MQVELNEKMEICSLVGTLGQTCRNILQYFGCWEELQEEKGKGTKASGKKIKI